MVDTTIFDQCVKNVDISTFFRGVIFVLNRTFLKNNLVNLGHLSKIGHTFFIYVQNRTRNFHLRPKSDKHDPPLIKPLIKP